MIRVKKAGKLFEVGEGDNVVIIEKKKNRFSIRGTVSSLDELLFIGNNLMGIADTFGKEANEPSNGTK